MLYTTKQFRRKHGYQAVIRELLDALDAEAKAEMEYQNAKNNFSGDLKPYIENGAKAALATLLAMKKAREAII